MAPGLPKLNSVDCATGTALLPCNPRYGSLLGEPKLDLANFLVDEDRDSAVFTEGHVTAGEFWTKDRFKTGTNGMVVILAPRAPFKVVKRVVGLVTVTVVAFISQWIRIRSDKSEQYKLVNTPLTLAPVFVKPYVVVPVLDARAQYNDRSAALGVNRTHPAPVANVVTPFVSRHRLPSFGKHLANNATRQPIGQPTLINLLQPLQLGALWQM